MRHAPAGWTASIGTALLLGFGGARVPARADETPGPPITGELATAVEPDLAALSTLDFFNALEQRLDWHSSGKDELWLVLDRCQAELDAERESEPSRQQFLHAWSCGRAGEALAETAEGSERSRLLDDFDAIPPSSPIRDALLRGFLASAMADKLRALEAAAGAARPPLPATALPEVPDGLATASTDLQNAWRLKTALARAYNDRIEAIQEEKGRVSVHREEGAFHAAITDFLRGRVGAADLRLSLAAPESRWGAYAFFTIFDDVPLSGIAPLVFPRLQRGPYQLVVRGPAGSWQSDRITLGADPALVTCGALEPPADPELDALIDETPPILRF